MNLLIKVLERVHLGMRVNVGKHVEVDDEKKD